jgi:hypothetical protein
VLASAINMKQFRKADVWEPKMCQNDVQIYIRIEGIIAKQGYIEHFAYINTQSGVNSFASAAYFQIT